MNGGFALHAALSAAHRRCKEACCVVWYPLLDGVDITPFYRRVAELPEAGIASLDDVGFDEKALL